MREAKYKYNIKTLSYERYEPTLKEKVFKVFTFISAGLVFATLFVTAFFLVVDSPKEVQLKRENAQLKLQYQLLNNKLSQVEDVLADIEERDNNIYRTIFESEPINRNLGVGGVNRYKQLEGFESSNLVISTSHKLDELSKRIYLQSKSFDEVYDMALKKEKMLASIPAIQPVDNEDLTRMASGYGYRIHPIYKVRKMHYGMDFTAPTGTPIYATGNGTIESLKKDRRGFGYHIIIDHGYGYKTLYAHMSKFAVKKGQKINRGEVIGYVGSTGTSTAPHLHYEVHKNGQPINPVNFYFNDLEPEEFDEMLKKSSSANQSFD